MQYPAHEELVAPARARAAPWRLMLGILLCAVVYAAGIAALFGILVAVSGLEGANAWLGRMSLAESPTATLLVLATFVGMGLGPMLAARLLHGRSAGSLFGRPRALLPGFAVGAGVCVLAYVATSLLPSGITPEANLAPGLWAAFLPIALVGILVQTGAEEVLFRGYLQSQLAARFASPLAWMVLPSALFAVLHYQPSVMGENAWLVVAAVFLFAVLAADLTARTGSIGAAWGFHFANNCVAILVVALDGPLSGLALYTIPMGVLTPAELRPLLLFDMGVTVAIWLGILLILRRR